MEKARICCRGLSFEGGLNGQLVVVDSVGCVWESSDLKVAENRSGGIDCFENAEDRFVFKIRCSARATALGSQMGQTCEEMRIVAAIALCNNVDC